jgi:hypothetical protein
MNTECGRVPNLHIEYEAQCMPVSLWLVARTTAERGSQPVNKFGISNHPDTQASTSLPWDLRGISLAGFSGSPKYSIVGTEMAAVGE